MQDVVIVAASRTAIGSFQGSLANVAAVDLGAAVIRRLLEQATPRLAPKGIVAIEVGGLQAAMEREFGHLGLLWLPSEDGSDCVCVIRAESLRAGAAAKTRPRRTTARR